MARGGKKEASAAPDPESEQRSKLKKLAFSKDILSQKPTNVCTSSALCPSKTLVKHHGKDILRKSQRKNRYLFSFPGLLGPISGGKIGELKDLATKNPILYMDFPKGQMKLFGTIIYPKNRYLTLQFSKGGKNVTCDDYFDNMIVFSDAWWIGTKDENPEELRLQFPEELNLEKHAEYDFKGGVSEKRRGSEKLAMKSSGHMSSKVDLEDDFSDNPNDPKDLSEVTPTRHSARTSGKTFKFAESSGGEDFIESPSEDENEKFDSEIRGNYTSTVFVVDNKDDVKSENKRIAKSKEPSNTDRAPLVQTTLSTLFKKVEEKKAQKDIKQKTNNFDVSQFTKGEKKIEEEEDVEILAKKTKKQLKILDSDSVYQRKSKVKASGSTSSRKAKVLISASQSSDPIDSSLVEEEDDIKEFSSTSEDMDASDEDWNA